VQASSARRGGCKERDAGWYGCRRPTIVVPRAELEPVLKVTLCKLVSPQPPQQEVAAFEVREIVVGRDEWTVVSLQRI
nr:hypothetical protein [Candidatus Sigynarchaeota archaeon]